MAIIHILDGYKGAFTNFRAPLIDELVRRGHEVFVSAPDMDETLCAGLARGGVRAIEISLRRGGINPLEDIRAIISIAGALRKSKADFLFAYSSKAVIYGMLAGALTGTRVKAAFITGLGYTFVSNTARGRVAGFFQRMLYLLALRFSQLVVFQNPDDLAEFADRGLLPKNLRIEITGGSGVDLVAFQAQPIRSHSSFLMVGRLLNGKGVREYYAAAAKLKTAYPEARFVLAGWFDEGNPDAIDSRLYGEICANGCVEYLGRLQDVRVALADCSVFVLPSYREGTPRSVLEALATGRAVITTDAPGCRETVINNENGFLVPIRDSDALANAMKRYLDDASLLSSHGRASRAWAERRFDVNVVNSQILAAVDLE